MVYCESGVKHVQHVHLHDREPYDRELQDHLVRQHFQDRIKSALPTRRPFMCPDEGCKVEGKDWQALMRHYTGKHGILEGYLKEVIASGQVARGMLRNKKKLKRIHFDFSFLI